MHGILARGGHRLAVVDTAQQAWDFINGNALVDLVFTELQLPGDNGLSLIRRLKQHCLFRLLPVVVYTEHGDRDAVKRGLDLRVQNFLIKPYHDDDIFAEIEKTEANPWRNRLFEEEKSFCKLLGLAPEDVRRMLDELRVALAVANAPLQKWTNLQDHREINGIAMKLREQAEAAGAWGVVDCLEALTTLTATNAWPAVPGALQALDFSALLVAHRIDPEARSPGFLNADEAASEQFVRERLAWSAAPAAGRCPVVDWTRLQTEIASLAGCPVIDSAAAAFQMVANGHPSSINPLMDLVARDPGLSAQMLIAANRVHPSADDFTRIEDARLAVGQLGEFRLEAEGRGLVLVDEKFFNLPPGFNWPEFWTFQRGVARIAQLTCRELEFHSLEPVARTAGQLHDLGKLLLARLHPAGFQAILDYARKQRVPLREAEHLFLGCTTAQLAGYFAEKFALSRRLTSVMRWIDDPAQAGDDRHLVAIVSLARDLCRHNHVGASGDPPVEQPLPIEETAEWQILSENVYTGFNLHKFEMQIHSYCGQLRTELSGHQGGSVGELIARATS
jgi:CheY-like chemotaxis protein/HD-like signal output (HDOD) protein